MPKTLAMLLKSYFPGFDVSTSGINDTTYLTVEGFVSYTLREVTDLMIIEDMTLFEESNSIYRNRSVGKFSDGLYAMHAIINIIISFRDMYGVKQITSDNKYFDIYFKRAYKSYIKNGPVSIADLISIESDKFAYLSIDDRFYKNNDNRIRLNVPYYPVKDILEHHNAFSIMGLVIPFEPTIQNARVLIRAGKILPINIYRRILMELMIYGNLNDSTCVTIIDSYFRVVNRDMITYIPLFKYFNIFIIDKYKLAEHGYYEEISKMSGISINFINEHYDDLKPYALNILKDIYCPLEYIDKNKRLVSKNNLWTEILLYNKNITRAFLIKNIRKHPNALIKHIDILEPGDERFFKRYRRKINWVEFYRVSRINHNLDVLSILDIKDK